MNERRRRRPCPEPQRKGLFGGNVTVRYGLLVVLLSMLFMMMYNRMFESSRLEGPIDDIFLRKAGNLSIVYAAGSDGEGALADYAERVSKLLGDKLSEKIPAYEDNSRGMKAARAGSVLLYGPVPENRVAREMSPSFPFRFERDRFGWADGRWLEASDWRLVFVWPNPLNSGEYALVYTASAPGRVTGINLIESPNFLPHDSTDYVLAVGDSILAAGFFDKDEEGNWSLPPDWLTPGER